MLRELLIQNFALIEKSTVEWQSGLNTITGETGAGKSILLGALNLVCGGRFEKQYVHDADKKCVVEATFAVHPKEKARFEELALEFEPETIVRREISASGKSRAFVNDTPVQVQSIKQLVEPWLQIHSQFNTVQLRDPLYFLTLIDDFGGHESALTNYSNALAKFRQARKDYDQFLSKKEAFEQEQAFLKMKYSELKELNPSEEDEFIEGKLQVLNSLDQVRSVILETIHLLDEADHGLVDKIGKLVGLIRTLSGYSDGYSFLENHSNDLQFQSDALLDALNRELEKLDVDDQELERVSSRFDKMEQLMTKFQWKDLQEMLSEYRQLQQQFGDGASDNNTQTEEAFKQQYDAAHQAVSQAGDSLFQQRKAAAEKLGKAIETVLAKLEMTAAQFAFSWNELDHFSDHGKHEVEVGFTANKGVGALPLHKIASGGELSRIMLAIRKIGAEKTQLPTLILDEIDTGVSGKIALKMGEVLEEIGERSQVISITHLPQVASKGGHHLKVLKTNNKERTTTEIRTLGMQERIEEIAALISGDGVGESAINHAKVLLNQE